MSRSATTHDATARVLLCGSGLAATFAPRPLLAQGCTQCRDNLRSMPPRTQSAFRQAIGLLLAVALLLSTITVLIARRLR